MNIINFKRNSVWFHAQLPKMKAFVDEMLQRREQMRIDNIVPVPIITGEDTTAFKDMPDDPKEAKFKTFAFAKDGLSFEKIKRVRVKVEESVDEPKEKQFQAFAFANPNDIDTDTDVDSPTESGDETEVAAHVKKRRKLSKKATDRYKPLKLTSSEKETSTDKGDKDSSSVFTRA